ncbi:MAG: succinylglutamate desuccinylase [Glaciecola sp.]
MQLQPTSSLSRAAIKDLITANFIQFCLQYTVEDTQYHFVLNNGCHVSLLADGILAFNHDQHATHTNGSDSKSIVLSCAVHGNETAPIEILNDLIRQLLSETLETSHRVLFIFGNIPAMAIAERFVDENLNRLFLKNQTNRSQEGVRASEIMTYVDTFFSMAENEKLHYDLHTAIRPSKNEKFAVYPFLHGREYNRAQLAFLSACDVNTILLSQSPTGTFSYYSSYHHHAHAFTVELGKVKPFGENNMASFKQVKKKLTELLAEQEVLLPAYQDCNLQIFNVNQVINKQQADFTLSFDDDTANFTQFKQGDVLASETGTTYVAQQDGEAIVFPNAKVEIGQRAILTVVPYEI